MGNIKWVGTFDIEVLLVSGFMVNFYGNLAILIFNVDVKKRSSLGLSSMVNYILVCWFWSKLCKSLMLPCGHFQNMNQSSKYLFHNRINYIFILLMYFFLPMIANRFPCKYAMFRMAYVSIILVTIAVPWVWM